MKKILLITVVAASAGLTTTPVLSGMLGFGSAKAYACSILDPTQCADLQGNDNAQGEETLGDQP